MSDYYNSNAAAANSRWLSDEVFRLIDIVQRDEAIYNPRHKYYFCRPYVENFWREVDLKLEKNPGASLAKWTNLRISFRREYTNYLEEKVPPCWSYFDRMFFLHPYLRKKHQQPKSLDSQVQDALVQISTLSNRLQRERAVAAAASSLTQQNPRDESPPLSGSNSHANAAPLDNYLDYFDEPEPHPNSSELDDIIAEEQQSRFPPLDSLNNDIKSECEDVGDDYDEPPLPSLLHDKARRRSELEDDDDDDDYPEQMLQQQQQQHQAQQQSANSNTAERNNRAVDADDVAIMRNFVLNSLHSSPGASQSRQQQQHHWRMQHLHRLQTRSYHEDLRAKRPRSQENISSSCSSTQMRLNASNSNNGNAGSSASHSNVSFVRPTFSKPPSSQELVSTTTASSSSAGNSSCNNAANVNHNNDADLTAISTSSNSNCSILNSQNVNSAAGSSSTRLHNRMDMPAVSSNLINNSTAGSSSATTLPTGSLSAQTPTHLELCDCKSDPDAMFLMSLLPDIQKLNGRDRGKIKIAFQNILQDYLYPD